MQKMFRQSDILSVIIGIIKQLKNVQLHKIQLCQWKPHRYWISSIEMRVFWTEIECLKSAARLLNRDYVNRKGLDLSKEVLWVFVGQRAAEIRAVKVGGWKKILPSSPVRTRIARAGPSSRIFFQTSFFDSSPALWPTKTHITSLEISKPSLLT